MLLEKYFNYDNMVLQIKLLPFYYEMGSVSVLGLILWNMALSISVSSVRSCFLKTCYGLLIYLFGVGGAHSWIHNAKCVKTYLTVFL